MSRVQERKKVEKMLNKRVYGVIGISSIMANWNADFTGYPKTTSKDDVFGSDKALKYTMKKLWDDEGKKVLYIKSLHFNKEHALVPRTLKERYEKIFEVNDLKKEKDSETVLKKLFDAVDVKNFGATFAEEGNNISITGAVQFGQGFNKYADSEAQEQDILSPFKNSKKEDDRNSTLGTKIVSDEAHYFYPFVINPLAYREYTELGVTEGYTEEDYENFKRTALVSATAFNTNAKAGCENELALFIETEPDLYIPDVSEHIVFRKGEQGNKNVIGLNCTDMINKMRDRIKAVEIYYNPRTTEIDMDIEGAKYFDIVTKEEV